MRLEHNQNAKGKEIYTLGINRTFLFDKPISKTPLTVRGKGVPLAENEQFQKWSKQKMISISFLLKLIDVAKEYDDADFIDQCWRAYHCLGSVYTSNGKLHGKYCGTRPCRLCCDIRKAEIIHEYYPTLKTWTDAYHVVLTVKSPTLTGLSKRIDENVFSLYKDCSPATEIKPKEKRHKANRDKVF